MFNFLNIFYVPVVSFTFKPSITLQKLYLNISHTLVLLKTPTVALLGLIDGVGTLRNVSLCVRV